MQQHTADVVLRSSDEETFHSWKCLLSISSPVFGDMFTLPQPDTSDNADSHCSGLPVIDLEEDSRTLGHLVSLCHPSSCTGKQFKVGSVGELRAVLEATVKYDMENGRRVALEQLSEPSILHKDPIGVYALACLHEHHEAAQLAAKHTLALPLAGRGYVPELEKIHAGKLWRLVLYREACTTAASSLATDHTWIVPTDVLSLFGCDGSENAEDLERTMIRNPPSRKYRSGRLEFVSVHKWWFEYMRKSERALQKCPHGDAVRNQTLVNDVLTDISTSKCNRCETSQVSEAFRSFVNIFAQKIDHQVAEVEINLGF